MSFWIVRPIVSRSLNNVSGNWQSWIDPDIGVGIAISIINIDVPGHGSSLGEELVKAREIANGQIAAERHVNGVTCPPVAIIEYGIDNPGGRSRHAFDVMAANRVVKVAVGNDEIICGIYVDAVGQPAGMAVAVKFVVAEIDVARLAARRQDAVLIVAEIAVDDG